MRSLRQHRGNAALWHPDQRRHSVGRSGLQRRDLPTRQEEGTMNVWTDLGKLTRWEWVKLVVGTPIALGIIWVLITFSWVAWGE